MADLYLHNEPLEEKMEDDTVKDIYDFFKIAGAQVIERTVEGAWIFWYCGRNWVVRWIHNLHEANEAMNAIEKNIWKDNGSSN